MKGKPFKYDESDTKQELIDKLYNDPLYGFIGQQKLYEKAKALNRRITLKDIKDYFQSRVDIQRFQHQKPAFEQFKIASANPDSWQIDLAFWFKQVILTGVNINSRLGYATLLPNKQAKTVLEALRSFVKSNKPSIITSDNGKEFMNKAVQRFFKDSNIEHYNNETGDHTTMGKIERFNRTIKQRLMKLPNRENLTPKLMKAIIFNYNNTVHRSIGMTPKEAKGYVAQEELNHNEDVMKTIDNALSVGINAKPTEAQVEQGDLFDIEKILAHKRMKDGRYKYHIKWADFDKPTWEPQDNLRLVNKNRMSTPEKKYFASLQRVRRSKKLKQ
ncbi:unnamed protein product [Phytophthora lilii]|uniref:Unnamed protein product n=1 Tax=Phytophthora lilii TaxID=2077276 RepID=A0A9W6U7T8_9STRA|nr:unnamed protein product [Phytophthora lilii]